MFEKIKGYYDNGLWTISQLENVVGNAISPEEYFLITGQEYKEKPNGVVINGKLVKALYSKKEFMLWCGVDKMVAVNTAISSGNQLVKTIHDLLMAADYIDIQDPDTIQMISTLGSVNAGQILSTQDVERILGGQPL